MTRNVLACALLLTACASQPTTSITPIAEHHAHLVSPAAAALHTETPLATVELPAELNRLLADRAARWNDAKALAELYTEDAYVLDSDGPTWLRGREDVAGYLSGLFARAHSVTPVAFGIDGAAGHIVGYYTRPDGASTRYFGHVQLSVRKGSDGTWRIAAETPVFPGPYTRAQVTAAELIAQLDDAGIRKAAVLSVAYWFGSGLRATPVENEYDKVRAENDWTAAEVARYPGRLYAFCSFNPLRDYAMTELERCAASRAFAGIKLHFGNSAVDIARTPEHVAHLKRIFRAANDRKLAILAHLWTNGAYEKEGGEHAKVFLNQLLTEAPDVVVQIAHMAGGGRSTEPALAVFADAIAAGDPRTRNLYFDVATLTAGQSVEGLKKDAARMRQIGFDRILYGTDTVPPNAPARESWGTFRARMPLTDEELRKIAGNVAPYMR